MADLRPDHRAARVAQVREAEQSATVGPAGLARRPPPVQGVLAIGDEYLEARGSKTKASKRLGALGLHVQSQLTSAVQIATGEIVDIAVAQREFDRLVVRVAKRLERPLPKDEEKAAAETALRERLVKVVELYQIRITERRKSALAIKAHNDSILKATKVAADQGIDREIKAVVIDGISNMAEQLRGSDEELH
ncbi:MAG: hypothetical protein IV100_17780 [Myxococcales bacterium]|nr:hypothetical protein [Myxococcales bacterium]